MKNRHWLEFTEYASIAGVATGAVASFLAKQALYLSTPLSVALLVGFANRRRVERLNEEKAATSIATLKRKLSKQIKLIDQHIQTLPTPEMVGDVRNSTLRHSRDELKQLTAKIHSIQEEMGQYASILDEQNSGGIRDEIRQLQGFYTEIYASLKQLQQTFNGLDAENKKKEVETLVSTLRSESEQLQSRFQSLTDQTQPILSYLQEQVNHLNRQNSAILQQVDANSLKRELDILMDAVADLAPKRELNTVMADVRTLQENQDAQGQAEESIRKQLQTVMHRLQAVPDVPQFRAQIEETLSWKLSGINKQLRSLPNTNQLQSKIKTTLKTELDTINRQLEKQSDVPPYRLIFDLNSHGRSTQQPLPLTGSQQILQEALSSTKERLIMVWPWSADMKMDKPLMQKLEQFVKQGRQLDIGWCHITSLEEERFLSVINRRWSLDPLHRRSLQRTLQYLLALKRRYPKHFKFRVLGAVENFLVSDRTFGVLGIENRLTPISAGEDISLKLWTSDQAVIQQLIQRFDDTDLVPEDVESHWNRAMTRYDLGDRLGAMTDINQVLAINPNYAAAYNMRGIIQLDEGDQDAAIADFDQSLSLDDTQTTAYCNRGFIRSEQGDQYRAIADFSLAIQAETNDATQASIPNPKLGISYFYRGLACQKLDDFEGAIADYSEALHHIEASPVIRYHRGITYQATRQYERAITDLEQAVALFKQQGSQTNTRRASRHLSQAREALAIDASTPVSSPASEVSPRTVASEAAPAPTPSAPVTPESADAVSGPDASSFPSPQKPDVTAEDAIASASESNAAMPNFIFPDESRSRPSMIQDMDTGSEPVAEEILEVNPEQPATASQADMNAVESQPDVDTNLPPQENITKSPAETSAQRPPRRRRRADLDKLVTSTLTNFFDEVDMEKLGTQTLDNFFSVVQDGPTAPPSEQSSEVENPFPPLPTNSDNNTQEDGAIDLFAEGPTETPESSHAGVSQNEHSQNTEANDQEGKEDKEIEKLVTSTLTNFFNDLTPEVTGESAPDFFEEVSSQDISEQTLFNFHRVIDDVPNSTPTPLLPEDNSTSTSEEILSSEQPILENQRIDVGDEEPIGQEDNSQVQPSMDDFFEATASEPISDGTLINFQHVVQDNSTNLSRTSEHTSAISVSSPSEHELENISESEIESLITSSPSEFLEAIETEDLGTQTLGNFMETLQDAFALDEPEDGEANPNGRITPVETDAISTVETENLTVHPVNEQLFQSPPMAPTGASSDAPPNPASSAPLNPETPVAEPPNPSNGQALSLEPNRLPVGTETMTNLMAAIAEEDLGTQTLRDFVAIMGEEKARYNPAENEPSAYELEDTVSDGDLHDSTAEPQDQMDPSAQSRTDSETTKATEAKGINPEEDSILFESLADFSDRF